MYWKRKVSQNPTFYQNGYPKLLNRDTDQAEMFYHGPVFLLQNILIQKVSK